MRRFVVAAVVFVAASPAMLLPSSSFAGERPQLLGCGMPELPVVGPAKDRIAAAQKNLKDGRYGQTWRIARSVPEMKEATDEDRARAHAMMGWVQWHSGNHDEAKKEFAEARKLDAGSIDAVLAIATDKKTNEEVKKALEA